MNEDTHVGHRKTEGLRRFSSGDCFFLGSGEVSGSVGGEGGGGGGAGGVWLVRYIMPL